MDDRMRKFLRMQHVHRQNSLWAQKFVEDDTDAAIKLLGAIGEAKTFEELEQAVDVTDGVSLFLIIKSLAATQISVQLVQWGQRIVDGDNAPKEGE